MFMLKYTAHHKSGKKVLVWTAALSKNLYCEDEQQNKFMLFTYLFILVQTKMSFFNVRCM